MKSRSIATVALLLLLVGPRGRAQVRRAGDHAVQPLVQLIPATDIVLPGSVDSNSPVVWEQLDGSPAMFVLTSSGGLPNRTVGQDLDHWGDPESIQVEPWPGEGVWMEAIIPDDVTGTWYGFYHNELTANECGDVGKVHPRIGAARSEDQGATWTNLGTILDTTPDTYACDTSNTYFVGGVGDLTAMLDADKHDVYIYFSQYGREASQQGVAVARLPWADVDDPVGKLTVWSDGVWLPPEAVEDDQGNVLWVYPPATPIMPTTRPWHTGDLVDAFWGPSIHWNEFLQQYVMLLNRARDDTFAQEGIYLSFNMRLDAPNTWSVPMKLIDGGGWYPQVVGLEPGRGTDRTAGRLARFFTAGTSYYFIEFSMPE